MRPRFRPYLFGSVLLLSACSESPPPTATEADTQATFAGSDACRDCHASQYSDWIGSHHDLAMQVAGAATVLGDFDNTTLQYFNTETDFLQEDGDFVVRTEGASGVPQDFKIAYTFGVTPLQQYLVALPGGRLQALPFAWDSRQPEEGGQHWYHLYPDEYVGPGDPLHWTGRQQNWNYMCAECHSTNLDVNYDPDSDGFATSWSEIDVGCEACHGPATNHIWQAQTGGLANDHGFAINLDDHGRAVWQMNTQSGIAQRSELAMRPPQQPESCGRCHARRGTITANYEYGKPLADTHRVSLLDAPLYFDDGQTRDEVYVYGSFVQSRMYRAGVTCSDCHNPHSLKLVTGDNPSAVCAQCHLPSKFASTGHHKHVAEQVACVDCHMPSRVYMGVDERRDHSFRVPRPDLSLTTNSPNACNDCHTDQDADWAATKASDWWGGAASRRPHFANALHNARVDFANSQLVRVINDADVSGIARATALTLFAGPYGQEESSAVEQALRDGDSLVRLGALRAVRGLPPELQIRLVVPLLNDLVRSVRIEAATVMAPLREYLPASGAAAFDVAANEFRAAQFAIASRPESHASLGDFEAALGNVEHALLHYGRALQIEPNFPLARVNFADALRRLGDEKRAESILREGIDLNSSDAALRHSLGLLLVRSGREDAGLEELREAARLDPGNSRYIYVVAISQNSSGQSSEAIGILETAMEEFPGDFDIAWALATILRDRGDISRATTIASQLAKRYPDNANVAALLASLGQN